MKRAILILILIGLVPLALASCVNYDTSAVAMHAGGYTVARSPATGMMMGMPNTSRHDAEKSKADAFYGRYPR